MRDLLNIVEEGAAVEGQYLLATHNLEEGTWRVTFYPSKVLAHVAYKEWSAVFTGDAYIAPVEETLHADRDSRNAAVQRRNSKL